MGGHGVDGGYLGARGIGADHEELADLLLQGPSLQRSRGRGIGDPGLRIVRRRRRVGRRRGGRGGARGGDRAVLRAPRGASGQGRAEQAGEDYGAPAHHPARGGGRRTGEEVVVHGPHPIPPLSGAASVSRHGMRRGGSGSSGSVAGGADGGLVSGPAVTAIGGAHGAAVEREPLTDTYSEPWTTMRRLCVPPIPDATASVRPAGMAREFPQARMSATSSGFERENGTTARKRS